MQFIIIKVNKSVINQNNNRDLKTKQKQPSEKSFKLFS